jgi:cardiolipin synthase A/B
MPAPPTYPPITAEVEGHRLSLFVSGADRFQALLTIINDAKRSLRLFFYIFGDDAAALQVREALIDARNRGVDVTLLVDSFGTADRPDAVYAPLIDAGIVFARFNPRWGRGYLLRNHQKIVVADESSALVGGSNVVEHYFSDDPDGKSWHDLFIRIEGPAAKRLARYHDHLKDWMLGDRPTLRRLVLLLARHSDGGGPLRWLMAGPFRRMSPLTLRVKQDIESSQRLDMIQAYFAPNWGMLRRIGRIASRKGGAARLITAARSDNGTTVAAARHCYRRLLSRGVAVYEYLPQMLHMKLIIADDITYIGSANFDMRSLFINAEIMLRIDDAVFAAQMRDMVEAHIVHCEIITQISHEANSGPLARAKRLLAYFLVSTVDFTVTRRFSLRRR